MISCGMESMLNNNPKAFVTELNLRIAKYSTIIAQRKGRSGKPDDTSITPQPAK